MQALPVSKEKEELLAMHSSIEEEELLHKELEEAIQAGYAVLEKLQSARQELSSAQGWGLYDIVGGGLVSSLIKHSHIDQVQGKIADLQVEILRFQKEAHDVKEMEPFAMDISDNMKFFDIAYDNIFTDVMVQNKIDATLSSVENVHDQIQTILNELLKRRMECEQALTKKMTSYQEKLQSVDVE